jgi:hypothetical protein
MSRTYRPVVTWLDQALACASEAIAEPKSNTVDLVASYEDKEDKVAPTPTRARDPIPLFQARQWLLAHDVFPGDLDGLARKMVDGDLVWSDVEPSAA